MTSIDPRPTTSTPYMNGSVVNLPTINGKSGFDYSANWERQKQTQYWLQGEFPQYSFIDDMWKAYR